MCDVADQPGFCRGLGSITEPRAGAAEISVSIRDRFLAVRPQVVLRLLKGEDLEALSRERKVTAAVLGQWREAFHVDGQASILR